MKIQKDQRLPAHVVILKNLSSDSSIQGSTASQVESSGSPANLLDGLNQAPSSAALADGDASGETFIRTDHLDGETDWKLGLRSPLTQYLPISEFQGVFLPDNIVEQLGDYASSFDTIRDFRRQVIWLS